MFDADQRKGDKHSFCMPALRHAAVLQPISQTKLFFKLVLK